MSVEQKKFFLKNFKDKKTLISGFQPPVKKPFISIFKCKNKITEEKIENDQIKIRTYGLMIKTHRENREKIKIIKEKPKKIVEDFFQKYKNCKETEYYWSDILHPKLLRHYSIENECSKSQNYSIKKNSNKNI